MLSKHITHIVVLGSIHRDPAPINIITSLLNKAIERKQPVIFCDEEDPTSTLDYKLQGNLQFIEINKILIERFALQSLLKKDLNRPYFPLCAFDKIKQLISGKFDEASVHGLLNYANWPEKVKLWKTLKQNNIPHYSIDAPTQIRQQALRGGQSFLQVESIRIEHMANNIINLMNTKLPIGGLIIVSAGLNHIPGLFAALKILTQEKVTSQEIIIQSQRLYSKYVEDGLEEHKKFLPLLKDKLPVKIQKSYNLEASPLNFCSENNKDNQFNSAILETLGDKFYTDYVISEFTADKAKLIESIFGVIKKQAADGSALVAIHSAYLLGPFRKILGLDRFRLTIKSDIFEKIDYLKANCSDMTIESEGSNKFLVTFPCSEETLAHLDIINKTEKWCAYSGNKVLALSL